MKHKLFSLAFSFVLMWTLGEFFGATYSENVIFSVCWAIATAIWLGIHSDVKKAILTKFHKAHP